MTDYSVLKADGLIIDEIRTRTLGEFEGVKPRSIRKRGYHRAIKRGEIWALMEEAQRKLMEDLANSFYTAIGDPIIDTNCKNNEMFFMGRYWDRACPEE